MFYKKKFQKSVSGILVTTMFFSVFSWGRPVEQNYLRAPAEVSERKVINLIQQRDTQNKFSNDNLTVPGLNFKIDDRFILVTGTAENLGKFLLALCKKMNGEKYSVEKSIEEMENYEKGDNTALKNPYTLNFGMHRIYVKAYPEGKMGLVYQYNDGGSAPIENSLKYFKEIKQTLAEIIKELKKDSTSSASWSSNALWQKYGGPIAESPIAIVAGYMIVNFIFPGSGLLIGAVIIGAFSGLIFWGGHIFRFLHGDREVLGQENVIKMSIITAVAGFLMALSGFDIRIISIIITAIDAYHFSVNNPALTKKIIKLVYNIKNRFSLEGLLLLFLYPSRLQIVSIIIALSSKLVIFDNYYNLFMYSVLPRMVLSQITFKVRKAGHTVKNIPISI